MKSLFEYSDYRLYLSDYYKEHKLKGSFFSYQYFADKAGFKSKDFLYRVIKGKKNLSNSSCIKISKAIGHAKKEAEYFANLVGFNQAKNHNEREHYYTQLEAINKRSKLSPGAALIKHDQYKLFSTWYHLVIRSLVDLYEFRGDYAWLAKKVHPPITPSMAKKSIVLLEKLGQIHRDNAGVYRITNKGITTGENVKKHALHNYYLETMKLAADSLDSQPRDKRNISGLTLGISKKGYLEIVKKLQNFRREIAEIANHDERAEMVYKFNFLLFPVSKTTDGGEEE